MVYLQRYLIVTRLVPREAAAVSARSVYTIQTYMVSCHFMQSHMRKLYACLPVTCHLHFWPNDRDLLRATAVTRGWNGYWNKSQHSKLTLDKKLLPPLLPVFKPEIFFLPLSYPWALTTELSLLPVTRQVRTPVTNHSDVTSAEIPKAIKGSHL